MLHNVGTNADTARHECLRYKLRLRHEHTALNAEKLRHYRISPSQAHQAPGIIKDGSEAGSSGPKCWRRKSKNALPLGRALSRSSAMR